MAVHTVLSSTEIKKILSNYQIGDLKDYVGIKEGIENTNYLVNTTQNKFILTIYEERIRDDLIPFYMDVMYNSCTNGIKCPTPIKDRNGQLINIIKKKSYGFFKFINGKSKKKWSKNNCYEVGKELAKFHIVNKDIITLNKNNFSLDFWNISFNKYKSLMNKELPGSFEIVNEEIKFLNKNWPLNLPEGIIHADLFPDNVLFSRSHKVSGMIDFYFACKDFFSYDIAIVINAWCFPENNFNKIFMNSILKGYESVRRLQIIEKKKLNVLLRGSSLRFLLTRIIDIQKKTKNKLLEIKNPEDFLKRLIFHRTISNENYGI